MQQTLVVPQFGVSTEEVAILEWLKETGDRVERGEPLLHVETDKATVEIESTHDGVLLEQLCAVGETLEVGQPYASLGSSDDTPDPAGTPDEPPAELDSVAETGGEREAAAVPDSDLPTRPEPEDLPPTPTDQVGPPHTGGRTLTLATPRARLLARELGLNLTEIVGSGPGGRIREADVEATEPARSAPQEPSLRSELEAGKDARGRAGGQSAPDSVIESLSPVQKVAVRRLLQQHRDTPQFHLDTVVDAGPIVAAMEEINNGLESRFSITDVIVRAAALALVDVPHANARWADGSRELLRSTDIGLAVASGIDLLVPVMRDVASLSLAGVREERLAVIAAARGRTITPERQGGASLTVSNLGMYKVDGVFPVLNPPEAMILGIGRIRPDERGSRLRVVAGADHRVLNGGTVAEYLSRLVELLERPLSALV